MTKTIPIHIQDGPPSDVETIKEKAISYEGLLPTR